jgi:hypothetical protein
MLCMLQAGWANLVFAGDGTHVVEMALPQPHALYTAHLAYALGMHYHLVPLRAVALHSAPRLHAPIAAVSRALRHALADHSLLRPNSSGFTSNSDEAVHGAQAAAAGGRVHDTPSSTDDDTPEHDVAANDQCGATGGGTTPMSIRAAREATGRTVEVVVARYAEPSPVWCAEVAARAAQSTNASVRCIVYNKGAPLSEQGRSGGTSDGVVRSEAAGSGGMIWRTLPNVGRESHTWLSHIVEEYESLAEWTVFMQADPSDHLLPGVGVEAYVDAARDAARHTFFPLSAACRADLLGLAFRTGFAPFAPFTGELIGPPPSHPSSWASINRKRLPILLQPLGLWSGDGESDDDLDAARGAADVPAFVNRSCVAFPYRRLDAGMRMLPTELHWISSRARDQRDGGLSRFWRAFLGGDPPSRLYHAQGVRSLSCCKPRSAPPNATTTHTVLDASSQTGL